MSDIAQIGFAADTSELKDAKSDLQALIPPAKAAEKEADKLAASFGKVDAAAGRLATAADKLGNVVDRLVGALDRKTGAAAKAAAGLRDEATAAEQAAAGTRSFATALDAAASSNLKAAAGVRGLGDALEEAARRAQLAGAAMGQFDAHVQARNSFMAAQGVRGLGDALSMAGKSARLTAHDMLNLTRQGADVGVTLAMGMNPFMIAMQQGPQIFDAFQVAAMRSGTTVKVVMAEVGRTIWAAFAPLLPILLAITVAVGAMAGAFALFHRAVNKGNKDLLDSMNLTEKQLERVKKAGVETSVTMGDTFVAAAGLIGEAIMTGPVGKALGWLGDTASKTFDAMTTAAVESVAFFVGVFVAGVKTIAANWRNLPHLVGAPVIATANAVIATVEAMVNASITVMNSLIAAANRLPGIDLPEFNRVSINRLENASASVAGGIVDDFAASMNETQDLVRKGMNAIGNEIGRRARNRRRGLIAEAAGDADPAKKGRTGKTDAENFSDIVAGADRDIAMLNAQIAGVNLTATAAARLANEQKLLNEAQQKGLTLTAAQRAQLIGLAGTITDLQMKLKNLEGFKQINDGAETAFAQLMAQAAQIGLVGEALARAQYEQQFFNEAVAKGIVLDAEQTRILQQKAAALAKLSAETQRLAFMEQARINAGENLTMLREELSYIGLSVAEVTRLRIENELLAQARRQNIALTKDDVAAIKDIAREQATLTDQVRVTREAFDFAKSSTRGFLGDLMNGLEQGKSVWQSFGDAVINVLNKIISKMADVAIEQLFSSGAGGGGGWINTAFNFVKSLFAKGDAFDNRGISKFAKGSAFTNQIVSKPTLFSFANGTQLGEMGEAGAEAIVPLKRGPDGSLGVQMYGAAPGSSSQSGGTITLIVEAEEGDMFVPRVRAISNDSAVNVVRAGLEEYDTNMPSRVQQIANDSRMRG